MVMVLVASPSSSKCGVMLSATVPSSLTLELTATASPLSSTGASATGVTLTESAEGRVGAEVMASAARACNGSDVRVTSNCGGCSDSEAGADAAGLERWHLV